MADHSFWEDAPLPQKINQCDLNSSTYGLTVLCSLYLTHFCALQLFPQVELATQGFKTTAAPRDALSKDAKLAIQLP
ncbi:hypothetical protein J8I82_38200, partial [Cupriavidus sp. LEh25]